MVAFPPVAWRRLRLLHQPMLVDFQMRMPLALGRRGHGVQYPHGSRQALPVLRPRLEGAGRGNDRDHRSATIYRSAFALVVAPPRPRRACHVSARRRARRPGSRVVGRVLGFLELADSKRLPPYWNFLWDSNPPTYYSSPSSSGSPLKSSTAAEADVAGA